jgi:hypothetical protein
MLECLLKGSWGEAINQGPARFVAAYVELRQANDRESAENMDGHDASCLQITAAAMTIQYHEFG